MYDMFLLCRLNHWLQGIKIFPVNRSICVRNIILDRYLRKSDNKNWITICSNSVDEVRGTGMSYDTQRMRNVHVPIHEGW